MGVLVIVIMITILGGGGDGDGADEIKTAKNKLNRATMYTRKGKSYHR